MPETLAGYNFAFLDELSKKAIRRALLKAVAIPGYQVPFGSRELPIARGWGTGGLQITLSLVGRGDTLKVIDQGTDEGVNAVNIRRLVERTAPGVATTTETSAATIIQSRHRVPERPLNPDQILVLQVPGPEPLRAVERREAETRRMHAEADYGRMWVALYEDIVQNGRVTRYAGYPVLVNHRHIMPARARIGTVCRPQLGDQRLRNWRYGRGSVRAARSTSRPSATTVTSPVTARSFTRTSASTAQSRRTRESTPAITQCKDMDLFLEKYAP
jgi:alpha-D-ribose 1-methylphosphonate 5-phosphate C-P lyase